jgi:putative flippase GtrA
VSLRTGLAYGLVALTCLGLHNGVMIASDAAMRGAGALAISTVGFAVSFVLVSLVGYALHSRFTFREAMSLSRYGRYALAMSTNTPLALGVTWVLRGPVALPMAYAAPLASCLMVGANFILSRWAIASPKPEG